MFKKWSPDLDGKETALVDSKRTWNKGGLYCFASFSLYPENPAFLSITKPGGSQSRRLLAPGTQAPFKIFVPPSLRCVPCLYAHSKAAGTAASAFSFQGQRKMKEMDAKWKGVFQHPTRGFPSHRIGQYHVTGHPVLKEGLKDLFFSFSREHCHSLHNQD